jgi:hypothetical protein
LEWHDSLEHCAWLSRSDKSGDAGNEDNPKKRSKKKKNDALYVVLDQVKSTMSLISETNVVRWSDNRWFRFKDAELCPK